MNRNEREYEPPKMKVFRFDDNDRVLTESGNPFDYAANALNDIFGGTNTTAD